MNQIKQALIHRHILLLALIFLHGCADSSPVPGDGAPYTGLDAGDGGDITSDFNESDQPLCGNGTLDPGEECDNGSDNSDSEPDACRSNCTFASCGDGTLDSGEECDDGNDVDGDGCTNACILVIVDLCSPCTADNNCGDESDACIALDSGHFCGSGCTANSDCPEGFYCDPVVTSAGQGALQCVPAAGACEPCFDPDRDGFGVGPDCLDVDCDQGDESIHPDAEELCDGVDNNCDGVVDEGFSLTDYYPDVDRDGFGDASSLPVSSCYAPENHVDNADDCDDDNAFTYPEAPEICDSLDNNCNDEVDDGTVSISFYPDSDGDGYGDFDVAATLSCEPLEGFVTDDTDCDDDNGLTFPDSTEICNDGLDNDCNSVTDCSDFTCRDSISCNTDCDDHALEPNDTQASAVHIAAGTFSGLFSCDGNPDYYAIDLNANSQLDVELLFSHDEGDIDLTIMDETERILAAGVSTSDNETLSITAPSSGTYYLLVELYADNGTVVGNGYDLVVAAVEAERECRDDGYEDNDTQASSSPVTPGEYNELTACPDDADYYAMALATGDEITVDVVFDSAAADLSIALTSPEGDAIGTIEANEGGYSVIYSAESAGNYILSISALEGDDIGVNYTLEIAVTSPEETCLSDRYEDNDSSDSATELGIGTFSELNSCPGDDDYYSIYLSTGDLLSVNLDFSVLSGDIDLHLYNPDGLLSAVSTSITNDESIVYTALQSGVYIIRVNLFFDLFEEGNEYELDIDIERAETSCTDDFFEENDLQESATPIAQGVVSGLISCPDDPDFYAIDLSIGDQVDATVSFSSEEGDIDLEMLDPEGTTVAYSLSTGDEEFIEYEVETPGVHLFKVSLYSDIGAVEGNSYELTLNNTSVEDSCDDDELEDNDTPETAYPLGSDIFTDLTSCEDDNDYYLLDLGEGDLVSVEIEFDDDQGDIDLSILDESGTILANSSSTGDMEEIAFEAPASGTYYILVYLYAEDGGIPGSSYDMLVILDEASVSCATDLYEENDTISQAVVIGDGEFDNLNVCGNDDDYYDVYLNEGDRLTVSVVFSDVEGDIDVRLIDPDFAEVGASTDTVVSNFLCDETCLWSNDGECDDGGPGAVFAVCDLGTDCMDCGPREVEEELSATTRVETISHIAAESGYHAILVELYEDMGDFPGTDYTMFVTLPVTSVSCPDDDLYEDNDSIDTASYLNEGNYSGMVACSGDSDFYEMLLFEGETMHVDVLFDHDEGDIDLFLYQGGAELMSSNSTSDNESISFTSGFFDFYVVEVVLHVDTGIVTGNPYELDISFD